MPSFSVILCVHRDNPWLEHAIYSILNQDDPHFEFLIGANACSDSLWDVLLRFGAKDNRIKLFRTSVAQLAFNLNFLANEAKGDYLVRMDADDISESHRIRALRKALERNPVDILGSSVVLIDDQDQVVGKMALPEEQSEIYRAMPSRTVFCHPAVALRREFLLGIRGYLGGLVSEDTDLWLRARRVGATMRNLSEPLLRYRIHENQSIGSRQGYAEVASYWLRELLIAPSWYSARGFIIALAKSLFAPILPGARRYRSPKVERS